MDDGRSMTRQEAVTGATLAGDAARTDAGAEYAAAWCGTSMPRLVRSGAECAHLVQQLMGEECCVAIRIVQVILHTLQHVTHLPVGEPVR